LRTTKAIVFDVWGSFGYFRRPYTTTTATTYPFPCRSNLEGLVGAIVGLGSDNYPDALASAQIAISLVNDVNRMPLVMTYTHSDFWDNVARYLKRKGALPYVRAPRRLEVLRNPSYRIFFASDDKELANELAVHLENHEAVYVPYLGSNSMLANFRLVDSRASFEPIAVPEDQQVPVSTVVPFKGRIPNVFVQKGVPYAIEHDIPAHLTAARELTHSYSAIFCPLGGRDIVVSGIQAYRVAFERDKVTNIVFLPTLGAAS
jgi:CRISPR-associated protein Cas5h